MTVAVRVLGPLQVVINGVDVTPHAPKERALLAMLVLNRGRVLSADHLIDELWPSLTADRGRRVLQVRVTELRKLFKEADAPINVEFVAGGYLLAVVPEDIDEHQFFSLVERARRSSEARDHAGASAAFREALLLWRGDALADVRGGVSLDAEASRLRDARLSAIEDRIDADLAMGCHQRVVSELDALVALHPLRERLWGQRVLALYRCARQAEALRACASIRRRLIDEIGVAPGPLLQALETAVLEQRRELDWSVVAERRKPSSLQVPRESPPPIHYARSEDGVNLAYQVAGDGPIDLILIPGFVSHLDVWWEAWSGRLVRRLASFSRLILFDKRGTGLSDRPPHSDLEQWMEDTRVVLDAVGSERAAVLGMSGGGAVAVLFAATYPERTRSLVLYGTTARYLRDEDYPIGMAPEQVDAEVKECESGWGTGIWFEDFCPSSSGDPVIKENFARFQRMAASPGAAAAYLRALLHMDVRHALPMISAPTLVLHATRDRTDPIERARYMAERIPDATLVELDSADHLIWFSDAIDVMTDEIQDFVTGAAPNREISRVLATVVFIDGVDDERKARELVDRFRGRTVRCTEEGILATFDGPARAIRCASTIVSDLRSAGLQARAGLHSGECESAGEDILGVAVEIARRVVDLAKPGEVLVSQTVRDLVTGAAITFDGRGCHALEAIPGKWRIYAVATTE
ncbi:MAG: alpha/beta fold hydrolase [Acidimicrobiales bacterium]